MRPAQAPQPAPAAPAAAERRRLGQSRARRPCGDKIAQANANAHAHAAAGAQGSGRSVTHTPTHNPPTRELLGQPSQPQARERASRSRCVCAHGTWCARCEMQGAWRRVERCALSSNLTSLGNTTPGPGGAPSPPPPPLRGGAGGRRTWGRCRGATSLGWRRRRSRTTRGL